MRKLVWTSDVRVALLIFVITAIPYFASAVGVANSMDAPQYALTRAIADHGRLSINGYPYISPDYAVVNDTIYTKRSPGVSFLAVPFYLYARTLSPRLYPPFPGEHIAAVNADSPLEAMTYGLVGLVAALAVTVFYFVQRQLGVSKLSSAVASLTLAFGSLLWCYSGSFVREPFVILLLLSAFLAALRLDGGALKWGYILGACLGLAVFCDNVAVIPSAIILAYAAYVIVRQRDYVLALAVVGSVVWALTLLIYYNLSVFHAPLVAQYLYDQNPLFRLPNVHFLSDLRYSIPVNLFSWQAIPRQTFEDVLTRYPEFANANAIPFALETSYHGIMIESPILFLAVPYGLARALKDRRYLLAFLVAASIFVLLCRLTYFFGGTIYDTRYFLPAVAFFFIPLGACLDAIRAHPKAWLRYAFMAVAGALIALSFFNGWEAAIQNFPPHISGVARSTLVNVLFGPEAVSRKKVINTVITRDNWRELFVQTFPNYANIVYLAPLLMLVVLGVLGVEQLAERQRPPVLSQEYAAGE